MEITKSWRHLFSAVLILGTNEGSVYERLQAAHQSHLIKIVPDPGLPGNLQGDFQNLMADLANLFSKSDRNDNESTSSLAKRVVALYDSVAKQLK